MVTCAHQKPATDCCARFSYRVPERIPLTPRFHQLHSNESFEGEAVMKYQT